ncbi:MAG: helix-turn-helix transcriptional regulator [Parvularculaceae bacterium]|nr:helix-turn-helix transcriptional regulator [Parvularculaceae bacterium]
MGQQRSHEGRQAFPAANALCAADAVNQDCLYARLLQAFRAPILIVVDGRVQFKNRAANRLINAGVLTLDAAGVARFADPCAEALLEEVRSKKRHSGTEIVRMRTNGPAMILQVMPIGRAAPARARRARADIPVLVFVMLLSEAGAIRKRAVDGIATLSKAEKEVLGALVGGESVRTIAEGSARSVATVRWHVKRLLTKTGARSIGDLTRIGSLLAPY